jgi:hypothetical protein
MLDHDTDTIRTKVASPDPRAVTQHDAECAAAVLDDGPRVVLVQPYHFACETWRSSDGFGGGLYSSERVVEVHAFRVPDLRTPRLANRRHITTRREIGRSGCCRRAEICS